jgi:hypothetical protein
MEDHHLIYSVEPKTMSSGTGLFDEFCALADADEGEFLRFGQKWVGLNLARKSCPHLEYADPIRGWRDIARRMRALCRIGAELSFGRVGRLEDWASLNVRVEDLEKSLNEARFALMSQVRQLVIQARLQPVLFWNPGKDGWQIDLDSSGGSNLMAVLCIQLMLRVADKDGFAICSICHRTYVPSRKPAASRQNYCDNPQCQRDRWKHIKRKQRQKKHKEEGNEGRKKPEKKTRQR